MKDDGLTCETLYEWREQVLKFRELTADARVMQSPERWEALVKGFTIIWLRLALALPRVDRPEADRLFQTAMSEYNVRADLIRCRAPKEREDECEDAGDHGDRLRRGDG